MRIVFLDNSGWDYTPLTPLRAPLGGSQSALCYLAAGLARRGHQVALANHAQPSEPGEPGEYGGIECLGAQATLNPGYLNRFDVVISISVTGAALRSSGVAVPMLLWAHHDIGQPAVAGLSNPRERESWNGFAMVSAWQAGRYVSHFGIPPARITIKRNAVAPSFLEAPVRTAYWFEEGRPPVLAYTSTPFRGLELLLTAFPTIREQIPGARLKVYSGMALYREKDGPDDFALLYTLCRALEGAEYRGPVAQSALAGELAQADILAYPCTFPETSCIAAMEAMAAGCLVMTTPLGALPETLGSHGHFHAPAKPNPEPLEFAAGYCRAAIATIREAETDPVRFRAALDGQSAEARASLDWDKRAAEWEGMLRAVLPPASI